MQLGAAFQTVDKALATGQIGVPVAARLILGAAQDPSQVRQMVASGVANVLRWLNARPRTLFARQAGDGQEVTTLVRCEGGQMALISASTYCEAMPKVEINIYGNRGLLAWEDAGDEATQSVAATSETAYESALAWLAKSLELNAAIQLSGTPLEVEPSVASAAGESVDIVSPPPAPRIAPQSPPYGVLLVAGDHTHQPGYAEAFLADGRCRLIGVTDEDQVTPERRVLNERMASRLGIPHLADWASSLARSDVDIVSVCAEPERRGRLIVAAARAGKHLYLDKPLAGSVTDARAIVAAVQAAGVLAHMFSQLHFDPATRVRKLLESGRVGELRAVHCDICFAKGHAGFADLSKPRCESAPPTCFELPDAKRELTNIGVYPAVMLAALVGRQVRRVCSATGNFFFAEHQARDMEDFGQVLMELDGGVTATITAGRVGWRSHPGFGLHRVCLVGSKGTAVVNAHRPRVEIWSDAEPWLPPARDPDDPMAMWSPLPHSRFKARPKETWIVPHDSPWLLDVRHFLDCLEQGRGSAMPVEIAAAATELLSAAYQSSASGKVVDVIRSK